MKQTLPWEHTREMGVITQKGKGNIMDAGSNQEDIKVFKEEPEKQDCLDDISGRKIKLQTHQQKEA